MYGHYTFPSGFRQPVYLIVDSVGKLDTFCKGWYLLSGMKRKKVKTGPFLFKVA